MNTLRNRVQIIGHLGADPEIKSVNENRKMARLSIATNEAYQDSNGERKEDTQWHHLTLWGKLAETAERYFRKGQELAIEGRLIYRSYDTKDGEHRHVTEIVVSEVVMLGRKQTEAVVSE